MNKSYEWISLLVSEGTLEILKYLAERDVGHFKELRSLKNFRTKRNFSSNTISLRIKELVGYGAIERTISDSKGRNLVAYRITDAGRKCIELADKFDDELSVVLKKK